MVQQFLNKLKDLLFGFYIEFVFFYSPVHLKNMNSNVFDSLQSLMNLSTIF